MKKNEVFNVVDESKNEEYNKYNELIIRGEYLRDSDIAMIQFPSSHDLNAWLTPEIEKVITDVGLWGLEGIAPVSNITSCFRADIWYDYFNYSAEDLVDGTLGYLTRAIPGAVLVKGPYGFSRRFIQIGNKILENDSYGHIYLLDENDNTLKRWDSKPENIDDIISVAKQINESKKRNENFDKVNIDSLKIGDKILLEFDEPSEELPFAQATVVALNWDSIKDNLAGRELTYYGPDISGIVVELDTSAGDLKQGHLIALDSIDDWWKNHTYKNPFVGESAFKKKENYLDSVETPKFSNDLQAGQRIEIDGGRIVTAMQFYPDGKMKVVDEITGDDFLVTPDRVTKVFENKKNESTSGTLFFDGSFQFVWADRTKTLDDDAASDYAADMDRKGFVFRSSNGTHLDWMNALQDARIGNNVKFYRPMRKR